MQAIRLNGFEGLSSMELHAVERPKPGAGQVLIEVKAAGINFAELELIEGRYSIGKQPPFVMGFEAAGIVSEVGAGVTHLRAGDPVTSLVASGGYAEYAVADANLALPIPEGISFAEATSIPVQGITAYLLLHLAARPRPEETVLIQAAAGGVGIYLVQLAKLMGVRKVIALAGSPAKIDLVKELGADVAIDYSQAHWAEQVRAATGGKGVDVVFEAASGSIGEESFRLVAPFGRTIVFGARNVHDDFPASRTRQLIFKNQTISGFNLPSLRPDEVATHVPGLLRLIAEKKIRLFAGHAFPLARYQEAFAALSSRGTVGKVVLVP